MKYWKWNLKYKKDIYYSLRQLKNTIQAVNNLDRFRHFISKSKRIDNDFTALKMYAWNIILFKETPVYRYLNLKVVIFSLAVNRICFQRTFSNAYTTTTC